MTVEVDRAETGESPTEQPAGTRGRLVYRQAVFTRLAHWLWAICLFFLLFSGLQIFNAHPLLYIGEQSGFAFDNSVLGMGAIRGPDGAITGVTEVIGQRFDTTGVFGVSGDPARPQFQGMPGWLTIPSYRDLATGRVVHFFFAWLLVATLAVWLVASLFNGHVRRDLAPGVRTWRNLPRDIWDHARFRFRHKRRYSPLQKISYAIVLFVLFPLIILTGLAMSPGMNAGWPWLLDVFGGRQTARTIHFCTMLALVAFFVVHIVMVLLAGPFNLMRSMITGWYRVDPGEGDGR